jgi:hypothetical protein
MSVAGVGASLWAHAVSLAGVDPQSVFQKLWIFQPILLFLLLPLGIKAVRRGVRTDPFGLPRVEWRILGALLIYYAGHFYFFMIMAAEHLRAALTWQMFSAGWILMFMLTSFYYWTRFAETKR